MVDQGIKSPAGGKISARLKLLYCPSTNQIDHQEVREGRCKMVRRRTATTRGFPASLGQVAKFATGVGICADVQKSCTFSSVRRHIIYEGAVGIIVESIPI